MLEFKIMKAINEGKYYEWKREFFRVCTEYDRVIASNQRWSSSPAYDEWVKQLEEMYKFFGDEYNEAVLTLWRKELPDAKAGKASTEPYKTDEGLRTE